MRHHIFEENPTNSYSIAVLIKGAGFAKLELERNYVAPLKQLGVPTTDVIAFTLDYGQAAKVAVKTIKAYLDNLLPALDSLGVKHLYVADASYFKTLAGVTKADPNFGYVMPCKVKGFEHMDVVLGLNHQALIYNPDLQAKLDLSLKTLATSIAGSYQAIGTGIIHSAQYPQGPQEIAQALQTLHGYPSLTCDIEGFSLRFNECGIGTIAFAWDQHNGMAFACDYEPVDPALAEHAAITNNTALMPGSFVPNLAVRRELKTFFETYQGELTFHHAGFDLKPIIFSLWMDGLLDTKGLLTGLDVMTKALHCTKIISYLAVNSTAGNTLGLKALAHEFAGNWAVEVKDIRKVPLAKLLEYNLIDALSTHYVRAKHWPTMVADNQEHLYRTLMLPSIKLLVQTELTGMPMSRKKIAEVKAKLQTIQLQQQDFIKNSKLIALLNLLLQHSEWDKDYQFRKGKAKNPDKIFPKNLAVFDDTVFNPNSGPQLQRLLYEQMGLPVIDLTDKKAPATGAETIEKLINHTTDPAYKALLSSLIEYGKVTKILSTFIPAFEQAISKDGSDIVWLHGSFNLGGTVSGRLSSSEPNLQNIPAKSHYAKLIKECFVGPHGWLFCGADFNSLEDMISALTTKDPNKLKVYTDGYDGHALRAVYYYPEELAHIDATDPKSVNTLKKDDHPLRQESKTPTFALTYGGTHYTLMANEGWSKEKAMAIEANYHKLYVVSDQYIQDRLRQAAKDGYVEVAFGLRVRTPLLKQVMFGGPKMPYEAAAEGRTAGNAMGQSYGLLNNRAAVDFWLKVWASKYRHDILPVGLIHDAIYPLIRDDIEIVEWANRELIKSMQWQDLPELHHPTVKLGAALDIFWPSWAHPTTIPNNADRATLIDTCNKAKADLLKKAA